MMVRYGHHYDVMAIPDLATAKFQHTEGDTVPLSFINGVLGPTPEILAESRPTPRRSYVSIHFLAEAPIVSPYDISTYSTGRMNSPFIAAEASQGSFFPPRVSRASDVLATLSPGPGTQQWNGGILTSFNRVVL